MPWIEDKDRKETIIRSTLKSLPDWFGIEEALEAYAQKGRELPSGRAFEDSEP